MYHKVQIPIYEPQFSKAIAIVRLTLMFGLCNDQTTIPNDIRLKENVAPCFFEHFKRHGYTEAGPWLWRKPIAIVQPLMELLKIPLNEKRGILQKFDEDMPLEKPFQRGTFSYSVLTTSLALGLVSTIMLNFYEKILRVRGGILAEVLKESNNLNRVAILQAYVDANPDLMVCPGCDGSPASLDDGFANVDADHFFPKSKYPFLTIHPLNLTPYCLECNTKYKKAKDALKASGVTSLADIYHPYLRPAHEEVEVVIERRPSDGQPSLYLRAQSDDPQHIARLNSLKYVLDLESRWNAVLTKNRLKTEFETAISTGAAFFSEESSLFRGRYDDTWFSDKLSILADSQKRFIGKKEWQVPFIAYIRWVSVDNQVRSDWRSKMLLVLDAGNKEYNPDTGRVEPKESK